MERMPRQNEEFSKMHLREILKADGLFKSHRNINKTSLAELSKHIKLQDAVEKLKVMEA